MYKFIKASQTPKLRYFGSSRSITNEPPRTHVSQSNLDELIRHNRTSRNSSVTIEPRGTKASQTNSTLISKIGCLCGWPLAWPMLRIWTAPTPRTGPQSSQSPPGDPRGRGNAWMGSPAETHGALRLESCTRLSGNFDEPRALHLTKFALTSQRLTSEARGAKPTTCAAALPRQPAHTPLDLRYPPAPPPAA